MVCAKALVMSQQMTKSWLRRRVEDAVRGGFTRAYETVKVDPPKFLLQLRVAYGLPITTFRGVYSVDLATVDGVAESVIRGGMKMAAAEGAGLGIGGIITIIPDLSILAGITLRTIQKLSLLYGFEFNTEALDRRRQRRRRGHQPRVAGETGCQPFRAPRNPANRRTGQR
ncbi:MAG: hypothetical protein DMG71_20855 [Acidobacteria bacterium]|nr:MAG: hypothetical protein DMG71_20855 [Acidobacteriota bacterium]